MADYSISELTAAARDAGFSGASLVTAVAVSLAENGSRTLRAVGVNSDQWHSRDRGPWQINDHWHPDVSDSCAFDLSCAAKAAFKISDQGRSWTPWATFTSGKYKQYLSDASANSSASPTVGATGSSDLFGIGSAIQAGAAQVLASAQVVGGAGLIVIGLVIAVVILVMRNA